MRRRSIASLVSDRAVPHGVAAAAAGLATLAGASVAEAQEEPIPYGQVSLFVGYTWGPEGGFTWGIEGRGGVDVRDQFACGSRPTFVGGGVARFSFVELRPQIHVGPQAGVGFGPMAALAELTLGYRWGDDRNAGGFSMPIGLELEVWAFQTFFRGDPMLADVSTGGGGGYAPREVGFSCAVAGRALHDELGHAPLPSVTHLDAPTERDELARALRSEWESRAAAEWASVPSFLQLADQLVAARAPESLVNRALLAAYDEVRHAETSARAAVHYGAAPLRLGRVSPHTRARAVGSDALVRLAVESWIDGCLGEGRAAEAARRESESASESREAASLQVMIARDERTHAELAWDVLAWALARGGEEVRSAVRAVRDASPSESGGAGGELDLSAHGLLARAEHERIGDDVRRRAVRRLDALLARA